MIKLLVLIGASFLQPQAEKDSIGVETINGKVFVIHKVGEKETLYALSKRYGTTVDAIVQPKSHSCFGAGDWSDTQGPVYSSCKIEAATLWRDHSRRDVKGNHVLDFQSHTMFQWMRSSNGIILHRTHFRSGRNLLLRERILLTSSTPEVVPPASSRKGVHTVAQKETMFSIARQYGVTVAQIKEWNNLAGNELSIGQTLFVSQPAKGSTQVKENVTTAKVDPSNNNAVNYGSNSTKRNTSSNNTNSKPNSNLFTDTTSDDPYF